MITVDTHIIIWEALRPDLLSKKAKKSIDNANDSDGIIICEISLWEIAMLIKKNRLKVQTSYLKFIKLIKNSNNYVLHGITPEIAELSTTLPNEINQDPADRIISATSLITKTPLLTADNNLRSSKILNTIW